MKPPWIYGGCDRNNYCDAEGNEDKLKACPPPLFRFVKNFFDEDGNQEKYNSNSKKAKYDNQSNVKLTIKWLFFFVEALIIQGAQNDHASKNQ